MKLVHVLVGDTANSFSGVADLAAGHGRLFIADSTIRRPHDPGPVGDNLRVFSFDSSSYERVATNPAVAARGVGHSILMGRMSLALAPDGSRLFVAYYGGVKILDASSLQLHGSFVLPGPGAAPVWSIACFGEHVIACLCSSRAPRASFGAFTRDGTFVRVLETSQRGMDPGSIEATWMAQRLVAADGCLYAVEQPPIMGPYLARLNNRDCIIAYSQAGRRILALAPNLENGCMYLLYKLDVEEPMRKHYELQSVCVAGDTLIVAGASGTGIGTGLLFKAIAGLG